jgi:transcriptional regulator with PAS, ATPase and Fis domain
MSNSELFKNIERSLYTFNFNNIIDICFDKVMKADDVGRNIKTNPKLSDDEKILFDNCIDKYMLSFNIVKETSSEHLENLFNTKRS